MSQAIEKLRNYPGCDGHSVQTFLNEDGKYTGFCYPLGKLISDPYHDKPADYKPVRKAKTHEEIQEEIKGVSEYQSLALEDRGLTVETLEYFNVKVGVSEEDGVTPTVIYQPYEVGGEIMGYKVKLIEPKRFWSIGDFKEAEPFGWRQAIDTGMPKLYVTEGEIDAMSLYQVLRDKAKKGKAEWRDSKPAIISLNSGAGSERVFLSKWSSKFYQNFKEVVIVFDTDEAGKKASKSAQTVLPDAKVVQLPMNDVNECLVQGRKKALVNAVLFRAKKPKNTRILRGSDLSLKAKTPPQLGISFPWRGMSKLTKGKRRKETIFIGAGVKQGKSILLSALATHDMVKHDSPILLAKPEEATVKTYQELVAQAAGIRFNDPDIKFDEDAYDAADKIIKDKAFIIDVYQFVDWDQLKADIRYAVVAEKVKDVYIDPITSLTVSMNSSEANEFLTEFSAELAAMTKDLDFTALMFCHLKAPPNGKTPHERGGKVQSNQFVNSRGMMRSAHQMWGLEGNRDPELDEEERNMRRLVLLEDREYGSSGIIHLSWSKQTGRFTEV